MSDGFFAPLVGLPARIDPGGDREYVIRDYFDAVRASGGIPVMLPLQEEPADLGSAMTFLDGILLTGADSDIDPAAYGAARQERCGTVQPMHERLDFFLLECARNRKLPVLAICFGIQSLNVSLGGTLIQDIPTETGTVVRHSVPESEGKPVHAIRIESGSILEVISGSIGTEVNSIHHQAIHAPGRGLRVLARCTDGIIESIGCFEHEQWILGVQWHPEKSVAYDKFSRNMFDTFIGECRSRRNHPAGTRPSDAVSPRGGSHA
jgi:putative glutamine amidotransferase